MVSHLFSLYPFRPADQKAVKDLILSGLVDHWGELDTTKNPDLNDIAESYKDACFLVARYEGRIVGTGALVPRTPDTAEVVRMSVAKDLRRQGVGRRILQALCDEAVARGFKYIILETTETWSEVIAFYQSFGFQITHYKDGDVYFKLNLTQQCK
jgi:GNAT superfamily N-acetyltransferase